MTKLEQVINGLLIHSKLDVCVKDDVVCPYFHDANCYESLRADAVELLKEQKPRLLTLDEVKAAKGSDMYLEIRGYRYGDEYITATTLDGVGTRGVSFYHNVFDFASYGKATMYGWRCWTARPTDEQRKLVKWDD